MYLLDQLQEQILKGFVHIILGDFNIDALKEEGNFLRHCLSEYEMVITSPTQISGLLIDHVYVHKNCFNHFTIDTLVHSIYFSDLDAIKVRLEKHL